MKQNTNVLFRHNIASSTFIKGHEFDFMAGQPRMTKVYVNTNM